MQRSRSADRKQTFRCHQENITPQPQSPFTLICLSEILFLNQGSIIFMISGSIKSKVSVTEMPSMWLSSRRVDAKIRGIWDNSKPLLVVWNLSVSLCVPWPRFSFCLFKWKQYQTPKLTCLNQQCIHILLFAHLWGRAWQEGAFITSEAISLSWVYLPTTCPPPLPSPQ